MIKSWFASGLIVLNVCFALTTAAERLQSNNAALVYDDVTERPTRLHRDAKKIYSSQFRIVEITRNDGFEPARPKGYDYRYWAVHITGDPRLPHYGQRPPNVICFFIVTADGRVIEPRVVGFATPARSHAMVKSIAYRRFFPARLNGKAVASLASFEAPANDVARFRL